LKDKISVCNEVYKWKVNINMMNTISSYQRNAGNKIVERFLETSGRWIILAAQMQSGKTGTYLFVACDMLRRKMVERVVIFSGNTELELKNQVSSDLDDFIGNRLENVFYGLSGRELEILRRMCRPKSGIKIHWGSDLEKCEQVYEKTLFIWDESHFAQSKINRPKKFLDLQQISANGNEEHLSSRGNYMLSVSATPFSEFSDMHILLQTKTVIKLKTDPGYYSVRDIITNKQLCGFSDWAETFEQACMENYDKEIPKYAIIRVQDNMISEINEIALRCGYIVQEFHTDKRDIDSLNDLRFAPEQNTIIIIKGMCRMGKVVPKQHLSFVMETAEKPRTDTILQGLLGRVCGWHNFRDIIVYVHNNIISSGELDRYCQWFHGDMCLPKRAMNIVSSRQNTTHHSNHPIIPIEFDVSDIPGFTAQKLANGNDIIVDEFLSKLDNKKYVNRNGKEQLDEIENQIRDILYADMHSGRLPNIELRDGNQRTYKNAVNVMYKSNRDGIYRSLGSSCGLKDSDYGKIRIYYFTNDFEEIKANTLYIDARTLSKNVHINLPTTTKKESFCSEFTRTEESGEKVSNNGSYYVSCPPESASSVEIMRGYIDDCIRISKMDMNVAHLPKKFTSNQISKKGYQGILVNKEVFNAISPRGEIYNYILREHSLKLKIMKKRGRISENHKEMGMVPLAEISWN